VDCAARTPDTDRVKAFIRRLLATYSESMVTLMLALAFRTGLLETLAGGAGTSEELAERIGAGVGSRAGTGGATWCCRGGAFGLPRPSR
jgi:hypothetical protein